MRVKIDQQPDLLAGNSQIRQELGLKDWLHSLHALDLNNNGVIDNQIKAVLANRLSFV